MFKPQEPTRGALRLARSLPFILILISLACSLPTTVSPTATVQPAAHQAYTNCPAAHAICTFAACNGREPTGYWHRTAPGEPNHVIFQPGNGPPIGRTRPDQPAGNKI